MLEHAPQKLSIDKESAKTVPDTMTGFIDYAEKEGYLKNAALLNGTIMANAKPCIKLVHDKKQKVESRPAIATGAVMTEPKVGRNDPCPCGSGKKYKKCCGLKATK
jgi:preprotein translocase subunit SecA